MKKRIMTLALSALLSLSMVTTVFAAVSPEVDPGTKLPAPEKVEWLEEIPGTVEWSVVPEAHGWYEFYYIINGETYGPATLNNNITSGNCRFYAQHLFEETGEYVFQVAAADNYDEETLANSDLTGSETYYYVRPEVELGTTTAFVGEENDGTFYYYGVENAAYYAVALYKVDEDGQLRRAAYYRDFSLENDGTTADLHSINFFENSRYDLSEGKYCVAIKAYSAEIEEIAHGEYGPVSAIYDTTTTADDVKDALENAATADEAKEALEAIGVDAVRTAMKTDPAVVEKVKEVEADYVSQNNITVEAPAVPAEVTEKYGVEADEITVVGAALNAAQGNNVQLAVSVPDELVNVESNQYKQSVQLDIKLEVEGQEAGGTLAVPVQITMPIPTGVEAKALTILHCHADGNREVIYPAVNGDGTITFTVTKFSTFVFANEKDTTENEPVNPGNGGGNSSTTDTTVVSPKTAEVSMMAMMAIGSAVAAAGTYAGYRRKK